MKRLSSRFESISTIFVFLLFSLFVVLSILLVLFSLYAYQHTISRTTEHNESRIVSSYIRSAVRAADRKGAITVQDMNGIPVLAVSDDEDGETYIKYIYCDGKTLRELYLSSEDSFDPELGEEICEVSSFDVQLNGLELTISSSLPTGETTDVRIALRAGL